MKKYLEKYREIKNNKRLFAIIKLGSWIMFFALVFLLFSNPFRDSKVVKNSTPEVEETELTNLLNTKIYKFNYEINGIKYVGNYHDNVLTLTSNQGSFMITNEKTLGTMENMILPDITYLYLNNLYDFIKSSIEDSVTKYRDGSIKYTYINETNEYNIVALVTVIDLHITNVEISYLDNNIKIEYYDLDNLDFIVDDSIYSYEYIREGE